jgi:hypothetical protein
MTETTESFVADAALTVYVDPVVLKKDMEIDMANLTDNMQKHASLYVHYATNAVRARRQHERFKTAFEVLEAQLDGLHRVALKEENPKTTEGQIRAAVVTDPRWKAMSSRVINAQQEFRMAEIAERAFDSRKDMLLQIARDAAREGQGQMRVMTAQTTEDSKARFLKAAAA